MHGGCPQTLGWVHAENESLSPVLWCSVGAYRGTPVDHQQLEFTVTTRPTKLCAPSEGCTGPGPIHGGPISQTARTQSIHSKRQPRTQMTCIQVHRSDLPWRHMAHCPIKTCFHRLTDQVRSLMTKGLK